MTHDDDDDALALLRAVYRDESLPLYQRLDAAKAAVKFERPQLAAVANVSNGGIGMAERLRRARLRVELDEAQAALPLIEGDYEDITNGA